MDGESDFAVIAFAVSAFSLSAVHGLKAGASAWMGPIAKVSQYSAFCFFEPKSCRSANFF